MATFYYNHESELYHSGRKGMKWGKHLPDILDPTRELVGKVATGVRKAGKKTKRFTNQIGLTGKKWDPKNQFSSKYLENKRAKMAAYEDQVDQQTKVELAYQKAELGEKEYREAAKEFERQQDIIDKALATAKKKPADAPRLLAIAAKAFANQKLHKKKMDKMYDELVSLMHDEMIRYESYNIQRHYDGWLDDPAVQEDFYRNSLGDDNYHKYYIPSKYKVTNIPKAGKY